MSPSAERWRAAPSSAAAAAALLTAMAVTGWTPAWADTARPGPVRDLSAPAAALYTGTESVDGAVTVESTRKGAKARIDATVLFGKDSAELRPGARDRIRQVADEFTKSGPGKVKVVGHTDDLGPARHGLTLSIRRAGVVADTLSDLLPGRGYPMTAIGKGEQDPAVPNTSEANRRKNRRVVITLDRAPAAKAEKQNAPPAAPQPAPQRAPAAKAPSPSAHGPTATASAAVSPAATPTERAQQDPSPTSRHASATPAVGPSGPAPTTSEPRRRLDPVLVSNLFLAAVVLAAALLALRGRFRRPPDTGPTPSPTPENPPPTTAGPDAVAGTASGPAVGTVPDSHPKSPIAPQDKSPTTTVRPGEAAPDRHSTARVDLAFPTRVRVDVQAPRAPMGQPDVDDLDADLRTWFAERCDLPRLSLLGPVIARAHGTPIARRKPFYTELLAFLALRPHGATVDQVADAFTLTPPRVRNDMKILRDWLGTNPRSGRRHLPDARDSAAGQARGMPVYQVEGLLVDLDLFTRLKNRGENAGANGLGDLDQALSLVRGRPFDQLRPHGWTWLDDGDRIDLHAQTAINRVSERAAQLRSQHGHRRPPDRAPEMAAPQSRAAGKPEPGAAGWPFGQNLEGTPVSASSIPRIEPASAQIKES